MRTRLTSLLIPCLVALCVVPPGRAMDTVPRPVSADGTYATVDLPAQRHVRNIGGSDGAGLCVFTSIGQSADWHNVPQLVGFQKWMSVRPGGGYPEKVDAEITAYCAAQGKPAPAYVQHVGGDEAFLDLAVKTGRMVGVTYAGVDGFYSGPILHMVNLAHLDANHAAIIDNNRPGKWVWMTRKEFLNRWRGVYDNGAIMTVRDGAQVYQVGGGWAFVLLAPPPPPYTTSPKLAHALSLPEAVNFGVRPIPQVPAVEAAPPGDNFGVDVQKLRAVNRKFSLNGTEVSKAVAFAAVLADDSDRCNLTFVGVPIPAGIPAAIRDKSHVQSYAADAWPVRQFALNPGVTLRKPATGRVAAEVLHLDAYDTSAILAAISGTPPTPDPVTPPAAPAIDNSKAFSVTGNDAQKAVIAAALSRCTFDFSRLSPGVVAATGRGKIAVSFGPMPQGVGGWASSDGSIKINSALPSAEAQSVFLMEAGHAVDFFLMNNATRAAIYAIFHPDGGDGHSWFDPSTYFARVGEAYTTAFTWAFSDLRPNPRNYTHATTQAVADKLRTILGGVAVPPVAPPAVPTPLGSILITLDDLTAAARARLDAAGVSALSLSVTPKPSPKPMPAPPVKAEGKPATPPETPAYPAPPGDGWTWTGECWTRPTPLGVPLYLPVTMPASPCANGRCPR